jgi:hypothetical protein
MNQLRRSHLVVSWSVAVLAGCTPISIPRPAPEPTPETAPAPAATERYDGQRYQAKVHFDPAAPQAISGFLRLGRAYSSTTGSAAVVTQSGSPRDLDAIIDAVNEYTQIRAELAPDLPYSDPRLLDLPIIIPQGQPNEVELAQLTRYLQEGGFVLDAGLGTEIYREGLEKYGGLIWGQDAWVERLGDGHPLFTAFFPLAGMTEAGTQAPQGIVINGRLAVLNFDILGPRQEEQHPATTISEVGGTDDRELLSPVAQEQSRELSAARRQRFSDLRFEQMVVNVVVYALTQEGSISRRNSGARAE